MFSIGKLDKALDEAQAKGSTVVSMKDDWKTMFLPEKNELRDMQVDALLIGIVQPSSNIVTAEWVE